MSKALHSRIPNCVPLVSPKSFLGIFAPDLSSKCLIKADIWII
jgi:hypothetical protein